MVNRQTSKLDASHVGSDREQEIRHRVHGIKPSSNQKPQGVSVKSIKYLDMNIPNAYFTLPRDGRRHNGVHWLVELLGLPGAVGPIKLDIAGDVILGMNRGGRLIPDLDLAPYGAHIRGVSRHHAMLRPSGTRLFLIDLRSSNGTCVNTLPLHRSSTYNLHSGDVISLSTLSFTLRIAQRPKP